MFRHHSLMFRCSSPDEPCQDAGLTWPKGLIWNHNYPVVLEFEIIFITTIVSPLLTYLVTKNTDPGQSRGKPRQVQPGKANLQVITAVIRPMQLNKSTRGRTKRQNKMKWRGRVISSCRVTPVDKFLEVKQLTVKIFSVKLFTLLSETLFGGKFTLSTQLMVLCWHSGLNFSIFPM